MPSVSRPNINLRRTLPSLFLALDRLQDRPYEAGWLLGSIHDIALCFIEDLVRADANHQRSRHLYKAHILAFGHVCEVGLSDDDESSSSLAGLFDMDELIDTVQRIHVARFPSSFTSVNSNSGDQETIDEVEDIFIANLYEAAFNHLYDGGTEHAEATIFDCGWTDGKLLVCQLLPI
jgi:hypothetical protein